MSSLCTVAHRHDRTSVQTVGRTEGPDLHVAVGHVGVRQPAPERRIFAQTVNVERLRSAATSSTKTMWWRA